MSDDDQLTCGAQIYLDPDECRQVKAWLRTQIGDGHGTWAKLLIDHIEDAQREHLEKVT